MVVVGAGDLPTGHAVQEDLLDPFWGFLWAPRFELDLLNSVLTSAPEFDFFFEVSWL